MKITVLAGGLSPERDVSLTSGSLIANALMSKGHEVALIDVYEGIDCKKEDIPSLFIKNGSYTYSVSETEPDLEAIKRKNGCREELIGPNVLDICRYGDVAFMALHGAMGEDGHLQATFDNYNIKYTGSGCIGCMLAMDKDISKRMFGYSGVLTPRWVLFDVKSGNAAEIEDKIGYPCVIKPCSCGSSVGVSIVNSREELDAALAAAAKYENSILAEEMISGREFTVGVLDGRALPAIEIIPTEGFYDYKNKYQAGRTVEICPAPISEEEGKRLANEAIKAHRALRLGDYSRIDFIMDKKGDFYCLEANALPGMTPTSLLPQEAKAVGIEYAELCEILAKLPFKE